MTDERSLLKQGAEAKIFTCDFQGRACVVKERFTKGYRHPVLDRSLTNQRTKSEVRSMMRCRASGIHTPTVFFVDLESNKIYMQYFSNSITVREHIVKVQTTNSDAITALRPLAAKIGSTLGLMHSKNIIHGDLTTSNMLLDGAPDDLNLVMIDFGLGYTESVAEDKGVDLYVLERALLSSHPNTEALFDVILENYQKAYRGKGSGEVISKLEEVRLRGRKRTMVG